jgi:superfamily II DNA or RNA helicase
MQSTESPAAKAAIAGIRSHYRSGEDDLSRDFFVPCLEHATWYGRAVGYFSSSALLSWAQVLPQIVEQPHKKIDLLIAPELSAQDIHALGTVSSEEERDLLRQRLADDIVLRTIAFANAPTDIDLRITVFTWLIAAGQLTLRFAFPEHVTTARLYHEKIGVFAFPWNAHIAFTGSANETEGGYIDNYESIDVFRDWVPADSERVSIKRQQFEEAWNGTAAGLKVRPLSPEAMSLIKERAGDTPPTGGSRKSTEQSQETKWRHQDEAIAAFKQHNRGVLEMATGTGKTRTALRLIQQLLVSRDIDTVIVSMDGNDLHAQWYEQLVLLSQTLGRTMAVLRHYASFKEYEPFLVDPSGMILLVARPNLRTSLLGLSAHRARKTMLIHDEVHRLGSPGNQRDLNGLSDNIRYRLGLSATPEREYDADGTAFIERHIGPVIYRFGLEDAIRRGILAPFDYHPVEWRPDDEDRERIKQVRKRAAARAAEGNHMSDAELWTELANVYKTSRVKIPLFADLVAKRPDLLERCIIFVATREFGDEILDIVHMHRHDFHKYFADDNSETLRRFARGDLECLITCHRLSEGIDIQSLRTVILLSSDRASLETIQRIGRCLRLDPANPMKRAQVVDFIRVRDEDSTSNEPTADEARRDWLAQLSLLQTEGPA